MPHLLPGTPPRLTQNFRGPLNVSRCCLQPICTECFVQIQRVDPKQTIPPSSKPAMCPFCVAPEFGIVYDPPASTDAAPSTAKPSAQAAIERAEAAIGTGGASTSGRTSYAPDHPRVVLVDTVHPHWHKKLDEALSTQARQANRRVIMRRVGDTLVPIGVSSSRTGETLAHAVSHNDRLGHNGPGGSIILNQNARITDLDLDRSTSRSTSALNRTLFRSRNSDRRQPQIGDSLSRTLLELTPQEMEQIMLSETLRISREEAEQRERERDATAAAAAAAPAATPAADAEPAPEPRRTPRLSFDLSRFRASSENARARTTPERAVPTPESTSTTDAVRSHAASPTSPTPPTSAASPTPTAPRAEPGAAPTPTVAVVPTAAPAAAEAPTPAPAAAPAPTPVPTLAPFAAAAPTAAPTAAPGVPASTAPAHARPYTPTFGHDVLAPTDAPHTPGSRPSPFSSGARSASGAFSGRGTPATPEMPRARTASNSPVHLSTSVMTDLQQLSGAPPSPAPRSPSTNPFRRRLDAAPP